MEVSSNITCPVCTLYLRPGITLETHLLSHPKQKVIEALCKVVQPTESNSSEQKLIESENPPTNMTIFPPGVNPNIAQINQVPMNQSFIYQQFMSSSATQPMMNQQFVAVPAVFNPQMMCPPYIFQQQQQVQIMSGTNMPFITPRPVNLLSNPAICQSTSVTEIMDPLRNATISEIPDEDYSSPTPPDQDDSKHDELTIVSSETDENDSIPKDLKDDQDKSDPDIIIETDGDDLVSVTVEDETLKDDVDQLIVITSDDFNEKIPDLSSKDYQKDDETNITVLDMSEVDFILPNDFMQNGQSIISRVNDIECLNEANRNDRPQILMSLGGEEVKSELIYQNKYIVSVPNFEAEKLDDESGESLNIRADERMPPRGELSEQESNGASEGGWGNRIYQEGSSGMSTSYDLLARESWEASDCSDNEIPPLQSRIQLDYKSDDVDDPDDIITKSPTFDFNCSICGETFRCPKERRVHQTKEHSVASSSATVTRKILTSSRKKPKIEKIETLPIFLKTEDEPHENEIKEAKIDIDTKENFLCNACGELLLSKKEWNIHNKKAHGIKIPNQNLVCKKCDVSFTAQDKFTEHLKIHPLECSICGKNFYKIPNLKIHLRRHTGIRPHKCDVCSKAFFSKQKLTEHSNIHTGNAPIRCTMCNQSFKRYSNLVQHRNRHHLNIKKKIKDYICHCGEIFHSKSKLQWHKETHESKPKGCKYCHEKFIHMASLTRHIRRIHNQRYVPDESRENENVECKICKGVYLKSSLDAHMQTHTGKKQHSCPICNKEFTTKWNLKLHKWTHASPNSKPFKCELCQAAYIRQNDYISHMNSHKSLRPYTCNYCGCKFIRKYNCIRHVREHEEGKSFTCVICNKSFHRSYYLNEHMRVHSGIRPYSCHICGKSSTTKSNHNKHMKIHHAREPIMTEG